MITKEEEQRKAGEILVWIPLCGMNLAIANGTHLCAALTPIFSGFFMNTSFDASSLLFPYRKYLYLCL